MKKLTVLFGCLAVLLSNVMCAVVAYDYCNILWQGKYGITSAPAEIAFLDTIPFVIGIAVCILLAVVFWKKSKKKLL